MLRLQDLKVGSKLAIAFAAILVMTIGLGGVAILRLKSVNDQSTIIADNWLPSTRLSGEVIARLGDIRRTQFRHLLATTPDEMEEAKQMILGYRAALLKANEAYVALISTDEERRQHAQFFATYTRYRDEVWPPVERESLAGNKARAAELLMAPESKRIFDEATAQGEATRGTQSARGRGGEPAG
jgi:methyl-accepting chemotaxis protein